MQTLSDIEDINSLEQESPQIVCVGNVWGLTNDYLHAVQGRMEHAKHTLQGLISNTPYLEKASALAKKKKDALQCNLCKSQELEDRKDGRAKNQRRNSCRT